MSALPPDSLWLFRVLSPLSPSSDSGIATLGIGGRLGSPIVGYNSRSSKSLTEL